MFTEDPRDKNVFRGLTSHKLRIREKMQEESRTRRGRKRKKNREETIEKERRKAQSVSKGVLCYSGCSERVSEW